MRSKNAAKNLVLYMGYEALVFLLGIIFPRYVILAYGSEINGLTSTITRVLSLINLLQAGTVGAAIFQMYKPVAEDDYEMQSSILYTSRKYYKRITVIYFALALCCGFFYGFYLQSVTLSFTEIFVSFVILAVNGSGTLLVRSVCDIYISPHQKKYYLILSQILEQIVRYGYIAVSLVFKLKFVHIYIAYLLGGSVGLLMDFWFYKRLSKGKICKDPKDKKYKIPDKSYLMMQSIGSESIAVSPSIIITTFINLVQASVFSIYSMIYSSMKTILNSIQLSFSAIFGNVVKTSKSEHIYNVYSVIELITIMLGTVLSVCVGFLMEPFIKLYTLGVTDAEYLYQILVVFVVCFTVAFTFSTSFGFVATVYGLFKVTCKITMLFSSIGILISLVCTMLFGMPYVMCGLIFYQVGSSVAILIELKKNINWFETHNLFRRTIVLIFFSITGLVSYYVFSPCIESWFSWAVWGCFIAATTSILLMFYCLLFERKQLVVIFEYARNLVKKERNEC